MEIDKIVTLIMAITIAILISCGIQAAVVLCDHPHAFVFSAYSVMDWAMQIAYWTFSVVFGIYLWNED